MTDYRGVISEDEFVEVARLRRRVVREAGTSSDATLWFGVGLVALALWGYTRAPKPSPESLWWLPFAVLCLALWWRRRADPRKVWRTQAALREEFRGSIVDTALEARLGAVDARIPWSFFSSHLASPRAVVLFVGTHLHVMLSRGMFVSDKEWMEALGTIGARVPHAVEEHGTSTRRVLRTLGWVFGLLVLFLAWHFAQIKK